MQQSRSYQTPRPHLLQQHCIVSLKCLEDVVVAAHLAQPVDCRVAVPACRLSAYAECILRKGCGVRLETSTAQIQNDRSAHSMGIRPHYHEAWQRGICGRRRMRNATKVRDSTVMQAVAQAR